MKDPEKIAFAYLSLNFSSIEYEPNGNVPPDFLIDGKIAVEVRRLNQNKLSDSGEYRGLESLQIALLETTKDLLHSMGPSKTGKSWYVYYTFRRPLPRMSNLKPKIREVLTEFRDGQLEICEFDITDRFTLKLAPSSNAFSDHFVLGGYADSDTTSWLIPELEKNIRICIQEKTKKIADVRSKYSEWWLILIDHIGYGEAERINVEHDWEKVILVNPLNPKQSYEI